MRLDLVERLDGRRVDSLELLVMQCGKGQRLEVEERSRGSSDLLRQEEMLEGDRQACLGLQPTIGDDGDVKVRGDGDRHRERDVTFIFCIALTKLEGVMEEDDVSIDILEENPKGLGSTVDLGVSTAATICARLVSILAYK